MRYYRKSNVFDTLLKPNFNHINSFGNSISNSIGSAIGSAVGVAVGSAFGTVMNEVAEEVADNFTTNMKIQKEQQQMILEKQKKLANLPARCPFCNAPTTGKEYCEYCASKLI